MSATASDRMRNIRVQLVEEQTAEKNVRNAFEIITTEPQKRLVAEALLVSTGDLLEVTHPIEATLALDPTRAPEGIYPVKQGDSVLADVLGPAAVGGLAQEDIAPYKGGVLMVFDNIQPSITTGNLEQRIKDMRLQPDFEASLRDFKVIGLKADPAGKAEHKFTKVAVVVVDPTIPYVEEGKANDAWQSQVAEKEKTIAQAAFASSRSLQRVTQFDATGGR